MNFHIMTLFPDLINAALSESITGRALKGGKIEAEVVNIRDYTLDPHRHTDDYPYGGGNGMVMQVEPIYRCFSDIRARIAETHKVETLIMLPCGDTFNEKIALDLSGFDDLILICGHYEGIDERVMELIPHREISLGDFVLTGGEYPALCIVDAVARLLPGVLGNDESYKDESFMDGLLEYPQYTRPEEYMGLRVPEVLLSGDHGKVAKWRQDKAIEKTKVRRPDLLKGKVQRIDLTKDN